MQFWDHSQRSKSGSAFEQYPRWFICIMTVPEKSYFRWQSQPFLLLFIFNIIFIYCIETEERKKQREIPVALLHCLWSFPLKVGAGGSRSLCMVACSLYHESHHLAPDCSCFMDQYVKVQTRSSQYKMATYRLGPFILWWVWVTGHWRVLNPVTMGSLSILPAHVNQS